MIKFKTSIESGLLVRPRITIYSTHLTKGGVLQNMFSKDSAGSPMLDVADALDLRNILDKFIKGEVS